MKDEAVDSFNIEEVNLSKLDRRTGLSRKKLLKDNRFVVGSKDHNERDEELKRILN